MKNLWIGLTACIICTPSFASDSKAGCIARAQTKYAAALQAATAEVQTAFDNCGISMHPSTDRCYQVASRRFDRAEKLANEQFKAEIALCR